MTLSTQTVNFAAVIFILPAKKKCSSVPTKLGSASISINLCRDTQYLITF